MKVDRLYKILSESTRQLRKGEVFEGTPSLVEQAKDLQPGEELKGGGVLEIYAMPPVSEASADLIKIDMEFVVIGVDKAAAERHRAELLQILRTYPQPERLADGPSYIEVGAVIGDQGAAFQLFALGEVLDLWKVITPATIGFSGEEARQMAGSGFVMITGFHEPAEQAA